MDDIEIKFEQVIKEDCVHITMVQAPFIIARVIQIKKQCDADEYKERFHVRYCSQVEGFNIFLRHSGFYAKPGRFIKPDEIKFVIDKMCKWYLPIISQEQKKQRYKIQSK